MLSEYPDEYWFCTAWPCVSVSVYDALPTATALASESLKLPDRIGNDSVRFLIAMFFWTWIATFFITSRLNDGNALSVAPAVAWSIWPSVRATGCAEAAPIAARVATAVERTSV